MTDFSIRYNTGSVNSNFVNDKGVNDKEKKSEKTPSTQAPAVNNVDDASTLAYMSNTPAVVAAMANINFVSKPDNMKNAIGNTIFNDEIASQIAKSLTYDAYIAAANALPDDVKASIEASMGKFQEGVVSIAPSVEEELGAAATESNVLAVSAAMLLANE